MARHRFQSWSTGARRYERQLQTVPNKVLSRALAGCVLLCLAIPILLYEANNGVSLMVNQEKSPVISTWSQFDGQQQCIRNAIAREVPRDAHVFINRNQSQFLSGQLLELSTPWAKPVVDRNRATYSLTIVGGTQCSGESLVVRAVG
jgi:hypothetical protein